MNIPNEVIGGVTGVALSALLIGGCLWAFRKEEPTTDWQTQSINFSTREAVIWFQDRPAMDKYLKWLPQHAPWRGYGNHPAEEEKPAITIIVTNVIHLQREREHEPGGIIITNAGYSDYWPTTLNRLLNGTGPRSYWNK